jgi:hypothetical protein
MHKEIALRWAETLRSGNYQQTQDYLRDHMGHCCLGVLCDIYRVEQGKGQWDLEGGNDPQCRPKGRQRLRMQDNNLDEALVGEFDIFTDAIAKAEGRE